MIELLQGYEWVYIKLHLPFTLIGEAINATLFKMVKKSNLSFMILRFNSYKSAQIILNHHRNLC
jgi:hypothetical protein